MIKIKKSDTIIDIINKINNSKDKNIIIEFPFGHPILHNYLSLKILKNKADKKWLTIVTSDVTSKKIGTPLWINYTLIKSSDFIEEENLLKHNYTFLEYFKFEFKKYLKEIKAFFSNSKKINSIRWASWKYNWSPVWLWFGISMLALSIFLLFFIFYFAVNKTYIYITPEIEVKTKSRNLIFIENTENVVEDRTRIIELKKVAKNITITDDFVTSWIDEESISKSMWKAYIINKTIEDIKLLDKTRLMTASWVLFEIVWRTSIPRATKSSSWEIVPEKTLVDIVSKTRDINWNFIWSNWNIESWVKLTIPWLPWSQETIFAVSEWEITWWKDEYKKILTENDIEVAKNLFEERLKKRAFEELKNQIDTDNKINNTNYDILSINDIISYRNLNIENVTSLIIWEEIEKFKLKWEIEVSTYIYNKDTVINKLRNTIKDLSLEEIENILLIDDKSLRVSNLVYKQDKPFELKATMEIQVYYSQNFLDKNSAYIDRLKQSILWLNKAEAKKVLLNNTKISNVEIETRPFFIQTIWNLPENIIFKVETK